MGAAMSSPWVQKLERAAGAWRAFEQAVLAVLTIGMVILSALQIILRNFFHTGIDWAGPMLGASLLWMTMLGALAATGGRQHITVDMLSPFLSPRVREGVRVLTNLFAAVVCGLLGEAAVRYVLLQREMGGLAAPGVPQWTVYTIVPACLALLAFRFALQTVCCAARAATGRLPPEELPPGVGE